MRWIIALTLLAAVGCGDDPIKKGKNVGPTNVGTNNVSTNNTTANNVAPNNVAPNNVSPNNVAPNNVSDGPCARLDQTSLSFPMTSLETSVVRTVALQNCSTTELLEVEAVSVEGDSFFANVQGEGVAQPGESIEIDVVFEPFESVEYVGAVVIAHSASDDPALVSLTGRGTSDVCVTPVARVRSANGGSFGMSAQVEPGDTVELDGSQSSSPFGGLTFAWSIVGAPAGSQAMLSNNAAASPVFTPDLAGEYRIRLLASDAEGSEPCETAEVTVRAVPPSNGGTKIFLQLTWSTPADADPTDFDSSDLDIHWMRNPGPWGSNMNDCHYAAVSPDWGVIGDTSDNPSLDLDDSAGEGPENISHENLEASKTYSAGVHYYDDKALGASKVTVRLYVNDVLTYETREQLISNKDDFMHVFDYSVSGGVTERLTTTPGIP